MPTKQYLYNPFNFDETVDTVLRTENRHYGVNRAKVGRAEVIASGVKLRWDKLKWKKDGNDQKKFDPKMEPTGVQRPLQKVENSAVLIINAHGSREEAAVGYLSGGTFADPDHQKWCLIGALQLAQMIQQDGLDPNHRIIKLNSCWAARGDDSFAAKLAKELGNLKYNQIRVGGFEQKYARNQQFTDLRGVLTDDENDEDGEKKITSNARGHRIWFDSKGSKVGTGSAATI